MIMTNSENGAKLMGRFLSGAVKRLRVASQH